MIVDTSALVEIALGAPGRDDLMRRIHAAQFAGAGTPTLAEAGLVINGRLGHIGSTILERTLAELNIQEIPFSEAHWREAVSAFRRFGKGRHPARLNFGDCLTYASASLSGEPLLYVGEDFTQTDLERA